MAVPQKFSKYKCTQLAKRDEPHLPKTNRFTEHSKNGMFI